MPNYRVFLLSCIHVQDKEKAKGNGFFNRLRVQKGEKYEAKKS